VRERDGDLVTAGGRVLNVCGRGEDVAAAREAAYRGVARITWPGIHHRHDIAAG
jgi:phosphoribosylamine--glycine ligase